MADELAAATAVIDLTQPSLPARLTIKAAGAARDRRLMTTRALLDAIRALPADRRPLLVNVSSVQDLTPDNQGRLSGRSAPQNRPRGFAHIGLPVRAAITASGVDTTFVHFGNLVYGAGKAFADITDTIRAGKARIIGNGRNRLPLTQAEDAGGAIAHLLTLDRDRITGRTVVAVPPQPVTQAELYAATARQLDRPIPKKAPQAIAALVAGAVNTQTMTLDAICEPDLLTATGYQFRHPTIQTGVPAALAALDTAL